jgi:hypothetical protein
MTRWVFIVPMLTVTSFVAVSTQGKPQTRPTPITRAAGETLVAGQCLFKEDLDLIKVLRSLKRTTLNDDAMAPFNPDYFVGSWMFEWEMPESALGPAGTITGTQTIRHVEGCGYEGTTQAKGPGGPFTINSTIVYDPAAKYLVVVDRDSRGFELLKLGRVGGDSGGYFTHHWETPTFSFKGTKVRLKGSTFMGSPANFRARSEISEGGPFVNLGSPWFQRQSAPPGN